MGTNRAMVLVGYTVEATDGEVGAIDRRTYDGRQVLVAGDDGALLKVDVNTVERIDHRDHRVYLAVSRRELRTR
ncbi:hypothetical protein [Dactylosporangium sp. NPDC048998]|uniref:hypothetical protein n=1 Tax=Dactylosporangium sp. NPDC048998 TaxID=3363976 RepID=UPI003719C345